MRVGRNDPCSCGSGKKYKRCCAGKQSKNEILFSKGLAALLGIILVLVVIVIVAAFYSSDGSSARPDRVWSSEHGHWHDVGGQRAGFDELPFPRPPGPAPVGKVWSPEHGHWHDAR